MTEITQIFSAVGFPVGLIAVVMVAFWRVLVWLAPRADAIFQAHISLVHRLESAVEKFECKYEPEKPKDRG